MEPKTLSQPKLFMLLLGCKPAGRHTEQHDIFFGIANELPELKADILNFWPEAQGKIHIDAWREVNVVNNYLVTPVPRSTTTNDPNKLFFINLGGYKANEFEEYHYRLLSVAVNQGVAIAESKRTTFYRHYDAPGATSHVDDKYGVDVDDLYDVQDILPSSTKESYMLRITPANAEEEDIINIGYLKLSKL